MDFSIGKDTFLFNLIGIENVSFLNCMYFDIMKMFCFFPCFPSSFLFPEPMLAQPVADSVYPVPITDPSQLMVALLDTEAESTAL